MTVFAWILRGILLLLLFVVLFPFEVILALALASPVAFAVFLLVLVFLVLIFVLALALHVLANLLDVLIILGLIGIAWKWPRGMRGSFFDKLRVAIHALKLELKAQMRYLTRADVGLIAGIVLIVLVLSLSSGALHFLLTVLVVLLLVGIVWKWPRNPRIRFLDKLRIALRALFDELRRMV